MRVLLLRANPRKTGYTQRLADWFLQGLREAGAEVSDVDLPALTITPCRGCYSCWHTTPGRCTHHDGMTPLLEEVLMADVLVCVTPFYYFTMSSCLKMFFERLLPLASPGVNTSGRGFARNTTRYPERWKGKRLVTLIAGALRDTAPYRPANETFQMIADSLELEVGGQLIRPESYLLDYPLSRPRTLRLIQAAFVQAGREAGRDGRLTQETMTAAARPLAVDFHHFRAYSNLYWEHACQMGRQALVPGEVQKRVSVDVRILMREMVRCVDAKATARTRAVLQFEFPDQGLCFEVDLDRGRCVLSQRRAERPDLCVRCDSATWSGLFMRQLDFYEALKHHRIVLEGDKSLFARLDRFFPPPSD